MRTIVAMARSISMILALGALLAAAGKAPAQDPPVHFDGEVIDGPPAPQEFPAWIAGMQRWRMEQLKRMGYDGGEYARPRA